MAKKGIDKLSEAKLIVHNVMTELAKVTGAHPTAPLSQELDLQRSALRDAWELLNDGLYALTAPEKPKKKGDKKKK